MGVPSQICSVTLRLCELVSACIVTGIVGEYEHRLSLANAGGNSRIVYTLVIGALSIVFALVLMPPLRYSFHGFPFDGVLFVCWMVAFGLLINLTGSRGCDSFWFWNYWGYYWGDFYYTVPRATLTQSVVGRTACGRWDSTLAFSILGGFCWLFSALLGMYNCASGSSKTRRSDKNNPYAANATAQSPADKPESV